MLTPPEIETTLKLTQVASRWEARRTAVAQLPPTTRSLGLYLLGLRADSTPEADSEQHPPRYRRNLPRQKAIEIGQLPAEERQQILTAFFPEMADVVERAWQMHQNLPFSTDYLSRGFRAPQRPTWFAEQQANFLLNLLQITDHYDQDVVWWARWTTHLQRHYWQSPVGLLCAAAIDLGDQRGAEVFQVLGQIANGADPVGMMGHYVISGLLTCAQPAAWAVVENLLLAAQRQEGLRQVILESVDLAHPGAFRRIVHLIIEYDLSRFSSVIRAVDLWFGLQLTVSETGLVRKGLAQLDRLLQSEAQICLDAIQGDDLQVAYLALCVLALTDIDQTLTHALPLLQASDANRRLLAAMFLAEAHLPEPVTALLAHLQDPDLHVATQAFHHLCRYKSDQIFAAIEQAISHFPKTEVQLAPRLWPWEAFSASQQMLVDALVQTRDQVPLTRLLVHLPAFSANGRGRVAQEIQRHQTFDEEITLAVLTLAGDRSSWVRRLALDLLKKLAMTPTVVGQCESYLTRSAGDLRRAALVMLMRQPDQELVTSVRRLLSGAAKQRAAGQELLAEMQKGQRAYQECIALASEFGLALLPESTPPTPSNESAAPAPVTHLPALYDPGLRTPPTPPRSGIRPLLVTPAARNCVQALDALIHEHRHQPIRFQATRTWQSEETEEVEQLLGNANWQFPTINPRLSRAENHSRLPLVALWGEWWQARDQQLRDADGLELVRALAACNSLRYWGNDNAQEQKVYRHLFAQPEQELRYRHLVPGLITWLLYLQPMPAVDFLCDAVEYSFYYLANQTEVKRWRSENRLLGWNQVTTTHSHLFTEQWKGAQVARFWGLQRWFDEPTPLATTTGLLGQAQHWWQKLQATITVSSAADSKDDIAQAARLERHRPGIDVVMWAYKQGSASEADIFDQVIGPRQQYQQNGYVHYEHYRDLGQLSGRRPPLRFTPYANDADLQSVIERCRQWILTVELPRGDLPTPATEAARSLRYSGGSEIFIKLLQALGKTELERGWSSDSQSKKSVLSHLIRVSAPSEADTPAKVATLLSAAGLREKQLLETAMFAPQWVGQIAAALEWPGFVETVWWFHAHTKDNAWSVEPEIREIWTSQIAERTPLTAQDLVDGAVDVAWFWRCYQAVGEESWQMLDQAAQFTSTGSGHTRARLFADAMVGKVAQAALIQQAQSKRHQDSIRALGLLPLTMGAAREDEILTRYQVLQKFARESKQFGSQRQASETLAVRIGMENLARTAGYPDPVRLQWAMERHALADLAAGPLRVQVEAVTIQLQIDALGNPQIDITKQGKTLKEIPAKLKKVAAVQALVERRREITQQMRRMRQALEQAMERGDLFSGAEIKQLMEHPLLRPLLEDLVFIEEASQQLGYPTADGCALAGLHTQQPLTDTARLRIAHPYDLYHSHHWADWQHECFSHERIQPFKQLFRELYLVTPAERETATFSRRYAGQQVNPKQAVALLGQRGWVVRPNEGIHRTFYDCNLTVWLDFEGGTYTPLEVEGLTLRYVYFTQRGNGQPLSLESVPPRVFSSAMRDLDLIVSVAHMSGVDPESSMSTVEMRATLVNETARLLKLPNVRTHAKHVLIEGELSSYTIHLGSGVVHRQPGGYVCIVPVHSQQRGRLFLPFADDDPKSAEILSKTVLLARDREIKDPTILQQILPVG